MAKSASPLRSNADPKVLSDLDRRARQILIGYSSVEENAALNTSLLDLKDKAKSHATQSVHRLIGPAALMPGHPNMMA